MARKCLHDILEQHSFGGTLGHLSQAWRTLGHLEVDDAVACGGVLEVVGWLRYQPLNHCSREFNNVLEDQESDHRPDACKVDAHQYGVHACVRSWMMAVILYRPFDKETHAHN